MSNTSGTIQTLQSIDLLPLTARGPLSSYLIDLIGQRPSDVSDLSPLRDLAESAVTGNSSLTHDDDVQVSLFLLYGLHYGSLGGLGVEWEWNPELIAARGRLERAFEAELRALIPVPQTPDATRAAVAQALAVLTAVEPGPSLSRFVAKKASPEQLQEFLIQRSIYTLREADPHSWAIPRLTGRPKAALVEIQADEYGDGRPERMHAEIFARTMRAMGLDSSYGHYIDVVPAITLASLNMMSMFGLNRRLKGAIVGHLAAFEMTSAIPNQMYGNGFRRHGHGESVTDYFDEHVEADAVHEQIAAHDLAGSLAEDEPALVADIMFGASACLTVDGWAADHMLTSWTNEQTSLRSKDTL